MELDLAYYLQKKAQAKEIFFRQNKIYNPYFKRDIVLNSDGFHHLQFSARRERDKKEQLYKFRLLPLGLELIKKSSTIQEYREILIPTKEDSAQGKSKFKIIKYWGLVEIMGEKQIKVRTVLRKVGNGEITFWSMMLYSKIKKGIQKTFDDGIKSL